MSKGIQNNRVRTVDIIYTKRGRHYKSINSPKAEITKFALSDDGVDYNLYDDNLPDAEKAKKILNTPQFSSWTDEISLMRNKLISRERNTVEVADMEVIPSSILFELETADDLDDKRTQNVTVNVNFPSPNGFKVTLASTKYLSLTDGNTPLPISYFDETPDVKTFGLQPQRLRRTDDDLITIDDEILQPEIFDPNDNDNNNDDGRQPSNTGSRVFQGSQSFTIPITYDGTRTPLKTLGGAQGGGYHSTVLNIESIDEGITKQVKVEIRKIGLQP